VFGLKILKGIFVVGEKNIFSEITQIVAIATEANTFVASMFKMDYNQKKLTGLMHSVQSLEKNLMKLLLE